VGAEQNAINKSKCKCCLHVTSGERTLQTVFTNAITPWFNVQPDAQIIFNPGNSRTHATATVLGVRVVVTF